MREVGLVASLFLTCTLFAQTPPQDSTSTAAPQSTAGSHDKTERCGITKLGQCAKDVFHDQVGIWTSPLRMKPHDAIWLVPFAGATGAAFAYDVDALQEVGTNKSLIDKSKIVSEFGSTYATFGEAGFMYLLGAATHNDHLRETGVLGAEAVIDASLVAGAVKLATNRERPDVGTGTGGFWPHGTSDYSVTTSFPSAHAASSWALARVISDEYKGWPVKLGAYGFALAISASRITGRRHFPSDVLVGGTFGYLIGGYVVRHHSSADTSERSFTVMPIIDESQRTYGMTMAFTPSTKPFVQTGSAFKKFTSVFH
jgi:membrane-associated phospholipid phosphatase